MPSRAVATAPSRGARSPLPAARAACNALKHGLCARTVVLLDDEDAAAFGAFEAAVRAELAPVGALQADLVARIVMAAWRARRGDRLEAALLREFLRTTTFRTERDVYESLGLEITRDCNGARTGNPSALSRLGVRRAVPLAQDPEIPSSGHRSAPPSCDLAARCRSLVHRPHDETNPRKHGKAMS